MGGADLHLLPLQFQDGLPQVLHVNDGDAEDAAHGRADHLRVINVRRPGICDDPGQPGALPGPQHGPEISRILDRLKDQEAGPLSPEHVRQRMLLLLRHCQNALGRLRVAHGAEHLFRHQLKGKPADLFPDLIRASLQKTLRHEHAPDPLLGDLREHPDSFHRKEGKLTPERSLLSEIPYLRRFFI